MEDLISRQTVMDFIRGLKRWCVRSEDGKFNNVGLLYDDVMFGLDRLPTVTPKQNIGHWFIDERPESDREVICSNCEQPIFKYYKLDCDYRPKYCPNCGAKMSENPTSSNCTACILDGTDACSRGAGRAVDGRVCYDYVGESEDNIGPDKKS